MKIDEVITFWGMEKKNLWTFFFLELFLSSLTFTEINNFKIPGETTLTQHSSDRLSIAYQKKKKLEKGVLC